MFGFHFRLVCEEDLRSPTWGSLVKFTAKLLLSLLSLPSEDDDAAPTPTPPPKVAQEISLSKRRKPPPSAA